MNYTIDYSNGDYAILGNGDRLEFAPTYGAAETTIASLNEAAASWAMGGAPAGREQPCNQPDNLCSVDDPCPAHAADAATWIAFNAQIGTCYICGAAAWDRNPQGPLCPDHFGVWQEWQHNNTPLLAQCAAVIDACLGGPVIGGGIVAELRRVRAALKESGW